MSRDYHEFTNPGMSLSDRRNLNVGDWWLNRIRCDKCLDEIQSNNRHDYKSCRCKAVSVDGGSWYLRRCFVEGVSYTELSVMFDDVRKEQECDKT